MPIEYVQLFGRNPVFQVLLPADFFDVEPRQVVSVHFKFQHVSGKP